MTSMRQVWRALPRPNPITCACLMGFLVCFAHNFQHFCSSSKLVQYVKWGCSLAKNCTCGQEHGQPAQKTLFKVVFDGFLVHITLGRKKDPFFLNIKNPIHQEVKRIPNIDPGLSWVGLLLVPID